jgi:Asparagine synthase
LRDATAPACFWTAWTCQPSSGVAIPSTSRCSSGQNRFCPIASSICSATGWKWRTQSKAACHSWIITSSSASVSLKIRGVTEKYLLREAAKPLITETVYRRQKHPFLSPPVTTVPRERFHQMMQDTLRGPVLASLPFYDQKNVVALLDQLPTMSDSDRVGWDPILMSVLSACVIQERFGLGSKAAGDDAFAVGSHTVMAISRKRVRATRRLDAA